MKVFANMSLAFSLDFRIRVSSVESWFGSAIEAVDTILRDEGDFCVASMVIDGND